MTLPDPPRVHLPHDAHAVGGDPRSMQELLLRVPEQLQESASQLGNRRLGRMLDALDARLGGIAVVAEAVRRRHNVSAILRSADAFGVHEVHLVTNGFHPSVGASRGAERWLAIHRARTTLECLESLRDRGFKVFVADIDPSPCSPEQLPIDRPLALVFGSELAGVSEQARALADGVVGLPMRGFVESLNVSVAAAIILRGVAERLRHQGDHALDPQERARTLQRWLAREDTYGQAAFRRARNQPPPSSEPQDDSGPSGE